MSRTKHARYNGHRYRNGSSGTAWRNRYAPHWKRLPPPAERAACAAVTEGDEHDVWTEPLSAEDLIPGYWDWRMLEARDCQYERDYNEWGDSSYDDDDYDDRGLEPDDPHWVDLYVDGHEDLPRDWRDDSREYDLCEYDNGEPVSWWDPSNDDDEWGWMALAEEMNRGEAPLPRDASIRSDIERAAERAKHRTRRRAARAA